MFDDHTEEILYFGRAKRCATTAQRLALFARDKGCTEWIPPTHHDTGEPLVNNHFHPHRYLTDKSDDEPNNVARQSY